MLACTFFKLRRDSYVEFLECAGEDVDVSLLRHVEIMRVLRRTNNCKNKNKGKSEMRGSLHYAMDDTTVHCFGRDDDICGGC